MPSFADVAAGLKMPLVEAMESQRAIRRLLPDPVDDEIVLRLIELALKAPTGSNQQTWEFIVVRDPAVRKRLARLTAVAWAAYRSLGPITARRNRKLGLRNLKAVEWQVEHFDEIPVIVVACLRGVRMCFPAVFAATYYGSIMPSVQNLLLAARAIGLGAALTTLPLWSTTLARRALRLPWNVTPCVAIPLGWPRGRYGPTTRTPVTHVVHLDRYGNCPWGQPRTTPTQAR